MNDTLTIPVSDLAVLDRAVARLQSPNLETQEIARLLVLDIVEEWARAADLRSKAWPDISDI